MRTITLKELEKEYTGIYSVKTDTPKGRTEKTFYELEIGDEVLIDNYFTTIIEGDKKMDNMSNKEVLDYAISLIDNDDTLVELLHGLDDIGNGYLQDDRLFYMDELDDLHCGLKLSDFIERLTPDFNIADNYFYYSIYGLESTSEPMASHYRVLGYDARTIIDDVIENYNNIDVKFISNELDEVIQEILERGL